MGVGFKLRTSNSNFKKNTGMARGGILKGLAPFKKYRIPHQIPRRGVFTLHHVDVSWDFAVLSVPHSFYPQAVLEPRP